LGEIISSIRLGKRQEKDKKMRKERNRKGKQNKRKKRNAMEGRFYCEALQPCRLFGHHGMDAAWEEIEITADVQ
jgi:hypothetical protein